MIAASYAAISVGIGLGVVLLVVGLLWIGYADESDWGDR